MEQRLVATILRLLLAFLVPLEYQYIRVSQLVVECLALALLVDTLASLTAGSTPQQLASPPCLGPVILLDI